MVGFQLLLLPLSRTQWKKCTFSGDGEFIVAGNVLYIVVSMLANTDRLLCKCILCACVYVCDLTDSMHCTSGTKPLGHLLRC